MRGRPGLWYDGRAQKGESHVAKVTLQEIAARCGVSRGTVDRVVNGRAGVAPAVAERVRQALEETGYRTPAQRRQAAAAAPVTVGFIMPNWNDYYKRKTREGVRAALRQIGDRRFRVQVEELRSRSIADYCAAIRKLEDAGMSGLVLNAADVPAMQVEIDRLDRAGIPVVTSNSDVPGSRRICHVGQDLVRSGRVAAGLLAPAVRDGSVLVICGNREFSAHFQRVEGFLNRMHELGDPASEVRVLECIERYDLTYDGVTDALRRDKRLRAIYMANESVPGCMEALAAHGRPDRPIHVVCNDLTPEARQYLAEGKIDFVVDSDFSGQAGRSVLVLYDLLCRGRQPEKTIEYVQTSVIPRELLC